LISKLPCCPARVSNAEFAALQKASEGQRVVDITVLGFGQRTLEPQTLLAHRSVEHIGAYNVDDITTVFFRDHRTRSWHRLVWEHVTSVLSSRRSQWM
jgi:hypothetical protein